MHKKKYTAPEVEIDLFSINCIFTMSDKDITDGSGVDGSDNEIIF